MQLKVYNKWTGGIENKVEEHLIRDISFTDASNLDNSTGSLRPVRSHRVDKSLNALTTNVIKEHVNDCEPLVELDTTIEFVNYGDTVYYIETEGSPLKQLVKANEAGTECDAVVTQHNTHLSITGTLTSTGEDIQQSIQTVLDEVYDFYNVEYLTAVNADVSYYDQPIGVHYDGGVPLGDNLFNLPIYNSFYTFKTLTGIVDSSNINSVISNHTALKLDTVNLLTDRITEMSGTLVARFNTLHNSNLLLSQSLNAIGVNVYTEHVLPAGASSYETQAGVLANIVNNLPTFIELMELVIDDSVSQWIYLDALTHIVTPSNGTSLFRGSVEGLAKALLTMFNTLIGAYSTYLVNNSAFTNSFSPSNALATDIRNFVNSHITDEEIDIMFYGLRKLDISSTASQGLKMIPRRGNATAEYFGETENTLELRYTNLRQALTTLRDKTSAYNLDTTMGEFIHSYAVVGYSSNTKAYSNLLTLPTVYNDSTITIQGFDAKLEVTDWYLYKKPYNETYYLKIASIPSNETEFLNISFDSPLGSVLGYKDQISTPHSDYIGITEYKGIMFLIQENSQKIWFTEKAYPNRMSSLNFVNASQNIKAISSNGAGVIIWTTNRTVYLLTVGNSSDGATTKDTIAIKQIAQNVGILNARAKTVNDNNVVWLSQYGFHNTSGYGSASITDTFWTPPKDLVEGEVLQTLQIAGIIYILYTPEGALPNKLLEFEPKTGKILTHNTPTVLSISEIKGRLFGVSTGNELIALFQGDEVTAFNVTLKRFAGYSYDVRQRFLGVMIYHDNKPYKEIDRDTTLEGAVTIDVDCRTIGTTKLTGCTATEVEFPNNNNQGYSVSIKLEGTLKINSVRLKYLTHQWED